jgi:hypothetical protein
MFSRGGINSWRWFWVLVCYMELQAERKWWSAFDSMEQRWGGDSWGRCHWTGLNYCARVSAEGGYEVLACFLTLLCPPPIQFVASTARGAGTGSLFGDVAKQGRLRASPLCISSPLRTVRDTRNKFASFRVLRQKQRENKRKLGKRTEVSYITNNKTWRILSYRCCNAVSEGFVFVCRCVASCNLLNRLITWPPLWEPKRLASLNWGEPIFCYIVFREGFKCASFDTVSQSVRCTQHRRVSRFPNRRSAVCIRALKLSSCSVWPFLNLKSVLQLILGLGQSNNLTEGES